MTSNPTDGPIHEWFNLSYSNYQVLHRTLMQSMPTEWQTRMVACLEELRDAFAHVEQPGRFRVEAATEHIVTEMTNAELRQAGVMADWYGGETFPGDTMPGPEFDEWRAQYETDEPTYSLDGEELDPHARVLIPTRDPIPHYRHAYIEPRLPEPEATIVASEIELEGGDVMLQELSVGDPIEIDKQTGPLAPGIWVITRFECERRCRARVRRLSTEEIQAARQREATARIYE